MTKREKVTLGIFIFVTITAGGLGYLLDQILTEQPKGNSLGMGVWLVLPFLTGIVLRSMNKDFTQMGFRPYFKHHMMWYAVAGLVFPFTMMFCIIIANALGGLRMDSVKPDDLLILMFTTFLANCIKNIFEEFAWRGCLVPYLEKTRMNDWMLYFISGLIWGMWHITYYMFFLPDGYFTQTSRPRMVVSGIILMIFWSPLFVELRRLTNSVWPCVILHSMEDAVPTMLFVTAGVFRLEEEYSFFLDPISGILPTTVVLAIGLVLRQYRITQEENGHQ